MVLLYPVHKSNGICRWACLYPAYINKDKSRAEGRRIPKDKVTDLKGYGSSKAALKQSVCMLVIVQNVWTLFKWCWKVVSMQNGHLQKTIWSAFLQVQAVVDSKDDAIFDTWYRDCLCESNKVLFVNACLAIKNEMICEEFIKYFALFLLWITSYYISALFFLVEQIIFCNIKEFLELCTRYKKELVYW